MIRGWWSSVVRLTNFSAFTGPSLHYLSNIFMQSLEFEDEAAHSTERPLFVAYFAVLRLFVHLSSASAFDSEVHQQLRW